MTLKTGVMADENAVLLHRNIYIILLFTLFTLYQLIYTFYAQLHAQTKSILYCRFFFFFFFLQYCEL